MKVGVVIPSRLAPRPGGRHVEDFGPELWLDGALASVFGQRGYREADWDVYVGLSPGALCPPHVREHAHVSWADSPGQAAAVNCAADLAALSSDVLLFLEDDDRWHPRKFEIQEPLLGVYPFASCTQRLLDVSGGVLGVNDYPAPSGWAMRSDVWSRVGGFNCGFRWMVDSEWLARLSHHKIRRAHLVERPAGSAPAAGRARQVARVADRSEVLETGADLLVDRTENPEGGMAKICRDFEAMREADEEASRLRDRFGGDPW